MIADKPSSNKSSKTKKSTAAKKQKVDTKIKNSKASVLFEARAEFIEGSDIGILVLHGFTGSTQSMRDVAYGLHEKGGYTISMPRLKGHGTTPQDMEKSNYKDWIESSVSALMELKTKVNKVFVLGLSMGGALTVYCGINFNIDGIIPINASIKLDNFKEIYDNKNIPRFFQGIGSDIKKPGVVELAYKEIPKKKIKDILELGDIIRPGLDKITIPSLIFCSEKDNVVPIENSKIIFDKISSKDKELIWLKNSYHVATLDTDKELIIKTSYDFIEKHK